MTENTEFKDQMRTLIQNVSANPAELEFPTDRWGFTSGIRKEVLKMAATVKGQKDKHDLLVGTLAILVAHIQKRLPIDAETQAKRVAEMQKFEKNRSHLDRISGRQAPLRSSTGESNG